MNTNASPLAVSVSHVQSLSATARIFQHLRPLAIGIAGLAILSAPLIRADVDTGTARVRHAPQINGTVEGSVQQMTAESVTLNSGAKITGDLLIPGSPSVRINGTPASYLGVQDGSGAVSPANHTVTLNSNSRLGYIVHRTDAETLPPVSAPRTPAGSRSVNLNTASDPVGDWKTLRNLNLNGNGGAPLTVPPGAYGTFSAGGGGFVLGVAGATEPAIYDFQQINLNGQSRIYVAGPVIVTVGNGFSPNSPIGDPNHPEWLTLNIYQGALNLNGGSALYGTLNVPNGTIIINGGTQLVGGLTCDRLTVNSGGLLRLQDATPGPANQAPVSYPQNLTIPESTPLPITLTGADPDGDALTYHIVAQPAHGTLTRTGADTADNPAFIYTPAPGYAGADSFTFKVNDGQTDSNVATVAITVTALPATIDAFAAAAIAAPIAEITASPSAGTASLTSIVTWASNNAGEVSVTGPGLSSTETAGSVSVTNGAGTHAYTITAQPKRETTLTWTVGNATTIILETPSGDLNVTGQSNAFITEAGNYRLRVSNSAGAVATSATVIMIWPAAAIASATVTVTEGSLVANSQELAISKNTTLPIVLTGHDPHGEAITFIITSQPSHGNLSGTLPNLSYKPAYGFVGIDTFMFRVFVGSRQSAEAVVTINVTDTGPILAAVSQTVTTSEDTPVSFVLSGSDSRGYPVSFDVSPLAADAGTLTGTAPSLGYVHSQAGAYTLDFTVNATVAGPAPVTGRVTILVTPLNEAPVVDAGPDQSVSGHTVALFGMVSDDGRPNPPGALTTQWSLVRGPAGGSATFSTPDATSTIVTVNKDGTYVFRLTTHDGLLQSEDTCEILFGGSNQPPQVTLLTPVGGSAYLIGDQVFFSSDAFDPDGEIMKVEYFVGEKKIGESTTSPYLVEWIADIQGSYGVQAVATDELGAQARSEARPGSGSSQILSGLRWMLPMTGTGSMYSGPTLQNVKTERTLTGLPEELYDISLHIRGLVEKKNYYEGENGVHWNKGGIPDSSTWNIYKLEISDPHQVYYLNSGQSYIDEVEIINYILPIQAYGGALITLWADAVDAAQITNWRGLIIPGVEDIEQPYNGQFIQMDVIQDIVADTDKITIFPRNSLSVDAGPDIYAKPGIPVTLRGAADFSTAPADAPRRVSWSILSGPPDAVTIEQTDAAITTAWFSQSGTYVLTLTASVNVGGIWDDTVDEVVVRVGDFGCSVPLPDGLVAWWPGEKSGEEVVGGFHLRGDFSYGFGKVGDGFRFENGPQQMASVIDTSALALIRTGGFTVEGWIKHDTYDTSGYLYGWLNRLGAYIQRVAGTIRFYPTDNWQDYASWSSLDWVHLAVVYDKNASQIRTYLNGSLIHEFSASLSEDRTDNGFAFGGISGLSVDELSLYSRALTAGEIASIYDLGSIGKCIDGLAMPILVSAGDDRVIPFGMTAQLRGSVTEGNFVSYRLTTAWTVVSAPAGVDPAAVAFTDSSVPVTGARFPADGDYVLRLTATDPGDPARTAFDEVTITVQPSPNKAPVVFLPEDTTITVEDALTIPAYVSDDDQPLPAPILLWTLVAGPAGGTVSFSDPAAATTTVTFSKHGVYKLRLAADDGALTARDDILITVLPAANKAPVVRLGTAPELPQNAVLTLHSLVTDDGLPLGSALTCQWTKISGPGSVSFGTPTEAETTAAFSAPGAYVLQLSASDGELTGSAQIVVNVIASQKTAPVVAFDPPTVTIPAGSAITLPAPQITHDPSTDPATLTYRWAQVSGPSITFSNATQPNPALTFSGPGTYVLRLTVTDGALAGYADLTVILQPGPNQAPKVSLGDNTEKPLHLPLHTTLNIEGAFSDDGQPAGCSYRRVWTVLSAPAGIAPSAVTLPPNPADPQNTLKRQIKFPAEGSYLIQLAITEYIDDTDYLTGSATLAVIVGPPENMAPFISISEDSAVTLPLNGILRIPAFVADDGLPADGELTAAWEILSAPAGGTVNFDAAPDPGDEFDYALTFTAEGVYKLRLTASDGELTDYDEITVTVTAPGNSAPMAYTGEAISLPLGTPLRYTAHVIDDALPAAPGTLGTAWSVLSAPSGVDPAAVTFTPAAATTPNLAPQTFHPVTTTINFPALGAYVLQFTADDGELTHAASLLVRVTEPDNQPPLVSIAAPAAHTLGDTLTLHGSATDDGLPAVPGALTLAWVVVSTPDGGSATFGAPASASTTVTFNGPGDYTLRLIADDGELSAHADLTLTVTSTPIPPANQPPVVAVPAPFTVTQGQAVNVSGAAADDGLPAIPGVLSTTWSFTGPSGGITLADPAALTTLVTFKKAGSYTLTLSATDGELSAAASTTVTVLPAENTGTPGGNGTTTGAFVLFAYYPAGYVEQNSSNLYAESVATDTGGAAITVEYVLTGPASAPAERRQITHTAPYYWEFRDLAPGSYTMHAIGRSSTGYEIQATPGSFTVLATGQSGSELPDGSRLTLSTPSPSADTTEITAPATLAGLVKVDGLTYYALQYRRAHETGAQWTTFATGAGTVGDAATSTPAPLGTLDPSLLRNGDYDLRIAAYVGGSATPAGVSESARVTIDGQRKVGHFSIAFKDLSLPLAGLPVEVVRSYDTRDRHLAGDFGYGWSLAVNSVKLTKNRPLGEDWEQTVGGGGLGFNTYAINPTKKHLITLSFPDDTMATFEVSVRGANGSNSQTGAPIGEVYFNFTPANTRTRGTLYFDTDGGALFKAYVSGYDWSGSTSVQLTEDGGDYYDPYDDWGYGYSDSAVFNPTRFRYTTDEGAVYVIDENLGLVSITDPQGNKLEVVRNGSTGRIEQITHSSGQAVLFHRDSTGRVSHLTDPYGGEIDYLYDARGDLVGVANRAAETTTFAYYNASDDGATLAHFLRDIIDPSGTLALRNEYDDEGRLIRQTDAHGNPVTYEHDTAAGIEKITNRLGYVTEHRYDAEGNVTRTINPDGGILDYEFSDAQNPNSVTRQIDALSRVTRYAYDAKGRVTREENHLGHATASTYDDKGNPTTITDALGRATRNTYTSSGLPTTMTDALGHATKFDAYDSRGNLLRLVDAAGRVTTSTYDGSDRLLTQTDAAGNTTTYTYDARGNVATETRRVAKPDLSGVETLVTAYEYDAENRVIQTTQPDGTVTTTDYNANGKPSKTTDASGRETFTDYDAAGNIIKTTRHPITESGVPGPASQPTTEETHYDAENHPVLTKDAADQWTRTDYDSMGRVIATWNLGTHATLSAAQAATPVLASATEYDLAGQVTASTDALGNTTRYEYDGAGRRVKVTSPTGTITRSTYDANGNPTAVTDAVGNITKHYYDELNRHTETQYPDGTRSTQSYDELGRRATATDPEGKTTRYIYDEAGRLEAVIDAAQQATSFAYDELGRQTAQIDAEGRKTSYTYSTSGQRATRTLPGGQTESYAYNADGSLASRTDFNGETVTFTYDGFGRLLQRTPSAAALARGALTATFSYDAAGRRTGQILQNAASVTQWWETYGYDDYGRLAQKRTPAGDIGYLYDAAGNLTALATSHGTQLHYAYDAENRLAEVTDATDGADRVTSYAYTPVGSLASVTLPNGLTTTYSYTSTNRVQSIANTVSSFTYALSPSGHRTQLAEAIGGVSRTSNYAYDNLYRLTREEIVATGSIAYTHDKVGNRLSRTSSASFQPAIPTVSAYHYDANDRLLNADAKTYTYDANGNTLTGIVGGAGINPGTAGILPALPVQDVWDHENRLIRRTSSTSSLNLNCIYDADGNRIAKTVNGITTYYLVDTQNLTGYAQVIEEITAPANSDPIANGTVTKRYAYGLDLISQQVWTTGDPLEPDHWRISYYGYDGLGSVRYLTDETAVITDRYTYDAFGTLLDAWSANPLTPADNVYLYAGEQWDGDLGMYYNRARYLNTDTGRFWSMDSYEGNNQEPLSLHKYLYAHSNPVAFTDPTGNMSIINITITLSIAFILSPAPLNAPGIGDRTFADTSGVDLAINIVGGKLIGDLIIGPLFRLAGYGVKKVGNLLFTRPTGQITSQAAGQATASALSPGVASTFESGIYRKIITTSRTVVYRAENAGFNGPGRWFGTAKPTSAIDAEEMYNMMKYGNDALRIATYELPAGTTVYVGRVAGGAGEQIFIIDPIAAGVKLIADEPLLSGLIGYGL